MFHSDALAAKGEKTFQTYTKTNAKTEESLLRPYEWMRNSVGECRKPRCLTHMNDKGFGPAVLDKSSSSAAAIRGREQQLIEANGGFRSSGGASGNAINGISPNNPNRGGHLDAAKKEFGK